MAAMKSANKELKGMMKTVKIQDIDVWSCHQVYAFLFIKSCFFSIHYFLLAQSMQDEMMDLMDVSTEIQESLGRSYNVPDDIDEEELMGGKTIL